MLKKLLATLLATATIFLCASTAFAAEPLLDGSFYAKQNVGNTCTLASAAMMLRRRAYLNGDAEWTSVTESAVRPYAWSNGLSWNFTYDGMKVQYGTLSSSGNTEELIALLNEHPEGIVAYNRHNPHAVLLTDYTDGVFYCADPAPGAGVGRIPFSSCTIAMSGVSCYWYVASDTSTHLENLEITEISIFGLCAPDNLAFGSKFNLSGSIKVPETTSLTEVTIKIVDAEGNVVQQATDFPEQPFTEWSFRCLNSDILFGQLGLGDYGFSVIIKDDAGTTLCYASSFTVSTDSTATSYYWTATDPANAA